MDKNKIRCIRDKGLIVQLTEILHLIESGQDISWGEIAFLEAHQREIKKYFPSEPLLWEWAGIPESEYRG